MKDELMFTCDCCGSTIHDERPIIRASGITVPTSGTYAHVIAYEYVCEGCDYCLTTNSLEAIAQHRHVFAHAN